MKLSACVEMLFVPETGDVADRIRLAKAAGFEAVEFWLWSNKDLSQIKDAIDETGIALAGIVAEPFAELTRPTDHDRFLAGLEKSRDVALSLGTKILICQSGPLLEGVDRSAQVAALTLAMDRSAEVLKGSGIKLALEPLNDRVDHPGYFLTDTSEAIKIIREVNRSEIGLTYDLYHSMVMGEDPEVVMAGNIHTVAHLHIADHPGRNQPGSGSLDLRRKLEWIHAEGYDGYVGLEFRPTASTNEALTQMRQSLSL